MTITLDKKRAGACDPIRIGCGAGERVCQRYLKTDPLKTSTHFRV